MNEKILYFLSYLVSIYIRLRGRKNADIHDILIVKLDEIGDIITALPVFYTIHNQYPSARMTLFCKPFNTVFFEHLDYINCITEHHQLKFDHPYDLIIELRGNWETLKYALRYRPQIFLDRGTVRLKNKFFGGQKNEILTNIQIIDSIVDKPVNLSNSIVFSKKEETKVRAFIKQQGLNKFVLLHLGARDEARRWPIDRFREIIAYINTKYSIHCILVGGPEDDSLNKTCLSAVKNKNNLNIVGKFNLLEFAALCSGATLFIGNESGPLHIAAAQNTPNIGLFGPGVKGVFYPINDKSIVHHYFLARRHNKQTVINSTIYSISVQEVKKSIDLMLS